MPVQERSTSAVGGQDEPPAALEVGRAAGDARRTDGLRATLVRFRGGDPGRGARQLAGTLAVFLAGGALALDVGTWFYPLGLLLGLIVAPLWLRLFVLQHDLGHGSLFKSRRLCAVLGSLLGVLTLTPYFRWRQTHGAHHATSGNLDERRLDRDIFTMTVREYEGAPRWRRLAYRAFRHPFVMFAVVPLFVFTIEQRFAYGENVRARERVSVWLTNAGLAAVALGFHATIGLGTALAVLLPMVVVAGGSGVWLFYVQHQFPGAYWVQDRHWNFEDASLLGSTYLDLPAPLRWLTANIGVHHVHHLDPSIPNYRLFEAHRSHPRLSDAPRIGLADAWRNTPVDLWDEATSRMVRFAEVAPKALAGTRPTTRRRPTAAPAAESRLG